MWRALFVSIAMSALAVADVRAQVPPAAVAPPTSCADLPLAFAAARTGDREGFLGAAGRIVDPDARRLAVWEFADAAGDRLSFQDIDQARRDLAGWPRARRRLELTERALVGAGLTPAQGVAWFGSSEPTTPQGAMALATAFQGVGQPERARALIKRFWRERPFDVSAQQEMLSRFGDYLDPEDHIRRLDILLWGPQGAAATAMLPLVPPDQRALAQARMDLRADRPDALDRAAELPPSVANDPGLAFEKVRWLRVQNRMGEGLALLGQLPASAPHEDGQARLFVESRLYFVEALQRRDWRVAYEVMARRRFAGGVQRAEAEFYAGWIALEQLKDPVTAAHHFQQVLIAGQSPLTQARALYWLGRSAEAQGRLDDAKAYYRSGGRFIFAFYGQLSAQKAGVSVLTLPSEPVLTAVDRTAFEARPLVKAARMLQELGETDLFKVFISELGAEAVGAKDVAQVMDLANAAGQPFAAMTAGRSAASRGVYLPERMYPLIATPRDLGAPDAPFILAIARQESSFDPRARTSAARGLMMLRPDTAQILARNLGLPYAQDMLWDADYNLKLGSAYLGQLVSRLGGSYLLAAAAYNAGPNRFPRWTSICGDPRAGDDPVDFIECVPFGETRDYMMRVMENLQVYRARLNGGAGPLKLEADLRRTLTGAPSSR